MPLDLPNQLEASGRILRPKVALKGSQVHLLPDCCSTGLQVLDLQIHAVEPFEFPIACLRDAGSKLRILALDFDCPPTNIEEVWDTICQHCQTLHGLIFKLKDMDESPYMFGKAKKFIAGILSISCLKSLASPA